MEVKNWNKNRKGVLLTLVTLILVILMIAELISYVYLNINSENITASAVVGSTSYSFASTITNNTAAFLHDSLYNALGTLIATQNPKANSPQINNTAFALKSLMYNGTLFGMNEISRMNGAMLVNYTNYLIMQARAQNLNLSVTNASLSVYQSSPYAINATYSALLVINSSYGQILYPLNATSQVLLNGTPDLYSVENNNNYIIKFGSLPNSYFIPIGLKRPWGINNTILSTVSSPFLFSAGTVIIENSITSCSGLPQRFQNNNFMLASTNSLLGACGTSRFIKLNQGSNLQNGSYIFAAAPVVDYIAFPYGGSPTNLSVLQSAIHSGYYYSNNLTPSYLEWAQNNLTEQSTQGLFSFNLYNRLVPEFVSPSVKSYISTNTIFTNNAKHVSISLWFQPNFIIPGSSEEGLAGENTVSDNLLYIAIKNNMIIFGSDDCPGGGYVASAPMSWIVQPNTWHNVIAVFNSSGPSTIYLDGYSVGSNVISMCGGAGTAAFTIGKGDNNYNYFNGSISNVQLYNISLDPQQVEKLYYDGIEGIAVNTSNLTGWWPINGNTNDYSGYGRNGSIIRSSSNSMTYSFIHGYTQDPIYDGAVNMNATNIVEGVMNCANINQCSNMSLQHLYVGQENLSSLIQSGGFTFSGGFSYSFLNVSLVPNVGSFNGNGYVFAPLNSSFNSPYKKGTFSVYAWVYLTPNTVGPVIDIMKCNPLSSSCSSTPIISVNGNTIYAGGSNVITYAYTVNSINTWHQVTASFNNYNENLYVDGALVDSLSGTFTPGTGSHFYWTTGCGIMCNTIGSSANTLYGKISDVQFIDQQLSGALEEYMYLNNTCESGNNPCPSSGYDIPTSDVWALSSPFGGLANQTYSFYKNENNQPSYQAEVAYFANNQGICTVASVIANTCGALITQP